MPFQKCRYPEDWLEISQRIRQRDGNKCAWCGVPNGAVGYRDEMGAFWLLYHSRDDVSVSSDILTDQGVKLITIVLTVAHLGVSKPDGQLGDKHDKMDCRDENLVALCQRCHLNYDRDEHMKNAAETRRRKKIKAGQMCLFEDYKET